MSRPECLITGCALVDDRGQRWTWGDLHRVGDTWVFNSVLRDSETAWRCDVLDDKSRRRILIVKGPFFERRGVIVIAGEAAYLNDVAKEYLERGKRLADGASLG